jgi:hypothetical protein
MGAAMVFFAVLCILFGVAPQLLYDYLPYPVEYEAYTASKVVFYLQLLLFSGLAFFLMLPLMRRTETISLDTDWLWRVGLARLADASLALMTRLAHTGRPPGAWRVCPSLAHRDHGALDRGAADDLRVLLLHRLSCRRPATAGCLRIPARPAGKRRTSARRGRSAGTAGP